MPGLVQPCAGHPRLKPYLDKTWMAGTTLAAAVAAARPAMTMREQTTSVLFRLGERANDRRPFFHFAAHERGEFGRRHRLRHGGIAFEALAHLRAGHHLIHKGVEALDDHLRHPGR